MLADSLFLPGQFYLESANLLKEFSFALTMPLADPIRSKQSMQFSFWGQS